MYTALLFLDVKKAFDNVCRTSLLSPTHSSYLGQCGVPEDLMLQLSDLYSDTWIDFMYEGCCVQTMKGIFQGDPFSS